MPTNKTIVINLNNIKGVTLYKMVRHAIKARERQLGVPVSIRDFCIAAGISHTQVYDYANGQKAGPEGALKIAQGLKAWGHDVKIITI